MRSYVLLQNTARFGGITVAFLLMNAAFGQTSTLVLTSSPSALALGNTVNLTLSLTSQPGSEPAALEWTMGYSPSMVTNLAVSTGPALTAAGKTVACSGASTGYTCVASGLNANSIANGVIATLAVTLAPGAA